ncbi:hypothetical protein ACSBR2_022544 [Camellia fascicularis]
MASSSTNNSNIRLKPRLCNCGRTIAIYISNTSHCNYFKFVDEDDEEVTSTIRSNTRACDAITVEEFNDLRAKLHGIENKNDEYRQRLERMENENDNYG